MVLMCGTPHKAGESGLERSDVNIKDPEAELGLNQTASVQQGWSL